MNNGIKPDTIVRTIILLLALINQIIVSMGKPIIQFDNELLTELLTNLITIGASLWAWWKNNSFTYEAIIADEELEAMRSIK